MRTNRHPGIEPYVSTAPAVEAAADSARQAVTAPAPVRFRARPDVGAARATTATVLLDLRTGTYHTLNEAAGRMWDALEMGAATLAQIVDVLAADYDAPRDTIARDANRVLDVLIEAGLVLTEVDE